MTETTTNRTGVVKLWLLNFVGNAALMAAAYFWLILPDSHGWQVLATVVSGAAILGLLVWLRAGTFAWFRVGEFRSSSDIGKAFRHSARHIPALAFWAAVGAVLGWLIWGLNDYAPQAAVWLRQKMNGGPSPRNVMNDLEWLLLLLVGWVLPCLWAPIATTISAVGVHPNHLVRSRGVWKRITYWLWMGLLLGVGLVVPCRLLWWVPAVENIRQQAWSMGGRFLLAYLIAVTAFVGLVWITGIYTDREDPLEISR